MRWRLSECRPTSLYKIQNHRRPVLPYKYRSHPKKICDPTARITLKKMRTMFLCHTAPSNVWTKLPNCDNHLVSFPTLVTFCHFCEKIISLQTVLSQLSGFRVKVYHFGRTTWCMMMCTVPWKLQSGYLLLLPFYDNTFTNTKKLLLL